MSQTISNYIDHALSRMLDKYPKLIDLRLTDLNFHIIKFRGDYKSKRGIALNRTDVGLPDGNTLEPINLKISLDIMILCSIIGPNGEYFDRIRNRLPDFRCHYVLMLKEEYEEEIFSTPESALKPVIKSHLKDALISFETAEDINLWKKSFNAINDIR